MIKLRKYHGDLVQSLGFELKNGKQASVGVITPGEFEFGTINPETIKVSSGNISVWHEESKEWIILGEDQSYKIPQSCNYKLKTNEISSFICFYD